MENSLKLQLENIRRHGMDAIKNMDSVSKDDIHKVNDEIQKITDQYIVKVDSLLGNKEKDIMRV